MGDREIVGEPTQKIRDEVGGKTEDKQVDFLIHVQLFCVCYVQYIGGANRKSGQGREGLDMAPVRSCQNGHGMWPSQSRGVCCFCYWLIKLIKHILLAQAWDALRTNIEDEVSPQLSSGKRQKCTFYLSSSIPILHFT